MEKQSIIGPLITAGLTGFGLYTGGKQIYEGYKDIEKGDTSRGLRNILAGGLYGGSSLLFPFGKSITGLIAGRLGKTLTKAPVSRGFSGLFRTPKPSMASGLISKLQTRMGKGPLGGAGKYGTLGLLGGGIADSMIAGQLTPGEKPTTPISNVEFSSLTPEEQQAYIQLLHPMSVPGVSFSDIKTLGGPDSFKATSQEV